MPSDYQSGWYDNQRRPMDASVESRRQNDFAYENDVRLQRLADESAQRAQALNNQGQNAALDRDMVYRNQNLAAQNVQNQLNNLVTARRDSANAINAAMLMGANSVMSNRNA